MRLQCNIYNRLHCVWHVVWMQIDTTLFLIGIRDEVTNRRRTTEETCLGYGINPTLNYRASPIMLCIKLIEITEHSSAFQIWMSLPYWSVRPLLQIRGWMWWQRLLHPNEDTLTTYQVEPLLRRLSNKVARSAEMCGSFWFLFVNFLPVKYIHCTFIYRIIFLLLWLLYSRVWISAST